MTVLSDYSVPLAVALNEANPVYHATTQVLAPALFDISPLDSFVPQ